MKFLKKLPGRLYFTLCLAALLSAQAFAYIVDPGTLTYLFTALAGLLVALGAAAAIYRRKIVLFFRNRGKKKAPAEDAVQDAMDDVVDPMADVVDPMADDSAGKP